MIFQPDIHPNDGDHNEDEVDVEVDKDNIKVF